MPRARSGVAHHHRVKKALKAARGRRGAPGHLHRLAVEAVVHAGTYAYRDRRNKKREFRALWITRLSAACRERGFRYSVFISALRQAGVILNRKMLSELAIHDPAGFDAVVKLVKPHLRMGKAA
jgi:large subunit ribosomal protein L20